MSDVQMEKIRRNLRDDQRDLLTGPDARMDAYYFGFSRTGDSHIDAILSAIAWAGKGSHHTESWQEDRHEYSYGPVATNESFIDVIQAAANDAADRAGVVYRQAIEDAAALAVGRPDFERVPSAESDYTAGCNDTSEQIAVAIRALVPRGDVEDEAPDMSGWPEQTDGDRGAQHADESDIQYAFRIWMNTESQDQFTDQHRIDMFEAGWDAALNHTNEGKR